MINTELLKKHLINVRGKSLTSKIVVIESDDWGAIRIPSKNIADRFIAKNYISASDPFTQYDSLETASDIHLLLEILGEVKNNQGENPVLTANWVMANPDFKKIKDNSFKSYYYETFQETYTKSKYREENLKLINQGIKDKLLVPQFHAREHLNVPLWMRYLKDGNTEFLDAFKYECFAIDDSNELNRRKNIMATYDYYRKEDLEVISSSIIDGLRLFNEAFGFNSSTTVCPCYVWNNHIEKSFSEKGIKTFQGSKFQQIPVEGQMKFKRKWRYNGQKSENKIYFIRNVLFEPALDPKIEWVGKALESIKIAFQWNQPAIIGMHRINFTSNLSVLNRDKNLQELKLLLQEIVKLWPDVTFIDSSKLRSLYE